MIVSDNLIYNNLIDVKELIFMVSEHISVDDNSVPMNSSPSKNQQNSENIFKILKVLPQDNSNYIVDTYKISSFLLISDAVNYDFKLLGFKKDIFFRFNDDSEKSSQNEEIIRLAAVTAPLNIEELDSDTIAVSVFRPISVLGWVFWISIFFLVGMIFNVTKLKKGLGFNLRDMFV